MALIEGIAALVAKVASASTIAQATAGLGIAVAGVTGAGAAGVLPGPVQDTVAGAVEAVTPFELPHSADDASGRPHTAPDVHEDDAPAPVVPTTTIVVPPPAAPTTEPEEQETEVEHGTETADGTHQHRGGRTSATAATADSSDDASEAPEAPEAGDDHSGGDTSGHGGDDSSGDSGGSGHDGGSGHGDD